jgi:hypothetical protein
MRNVYKIIIRKLKGRDHLEVLGVNRRIILKRILEKSGEMAWTGFTWLTIGTDGELL